jgi:peptidoglycan/LPS O-acetylase OafA/YrhL
MQNYLFWRAALFWWERALVPIGIVSYSIYLWHYPLIKIVHRGFAHVFDVPQTLSWQTAIYLPLTLLCLAPIVVASYILFECRAMEWLRLRYRQRANVLTVASGRKD